MLKKLVKILTLCAVFCAVPLALAEEPSKKAEQERPKITVDVYRGDKHVQESFR